jgi:hypothetical protein
MIAVTETTRAAAQATVEYQKYLGRAGITMIRVWNTDADEKVCPICTGEAYGVNLNGMTEDEWPAEVAGGPPAHVNCRCDTSLRLLREAPPEATPQAPQQPEVISRQSSVDALYDHAKSLLPDNAQQVEQELFSIQDDISTLRKELKKLTVGTPEHTAKQAEWKAAQTRLVAKWEEKAAIDGAAARKLLQSLQHETPQTAQVTFSIKGLSAADRARVEELIKLTAGIAPDTGTPMSVTVKTLNVNGAGAAWTGSATKGTLYINPQNIPDVYVIHETLHGLQSNYRYGVRATDEWAAPRIVGESTRRMSTLDPTRYGHTPNNFIAYKDAVEDIQTLHEYKKGNGTGTQLPEVLTMPLTSLTQSTNGRDPDLLRLFLQIAKDDGK